MPSIDTPHGTTVAAFKGLAIASSFLLAGNLATITAHVPALYASADLSHRLAAQQFTLQYKSTKKVLPPAIIATGLVYAAVAYVSLRHGSAGELKRKVLGGRIVEVWQLWAGAAAAVLATIPFTVALMEPATKKLLWVGEVADSATKTVGPPSSTGIGVKVVDESARFGAEAGSGILGVPEPANRGAITPIEEFEPFEDAIVGEEYEQLKVKKLLQIFDRYNALKTWLPVVAGSLGLAAVFLE